jgi:hypothetical protein
VRLTAHAGFGGRLPGNGQPTLLLIEGLLWAVLALMILGPSPARRWWADTATAALTVTGVLSTLHVIGHIVIF